MEVSDVRVAFEETIVTVALDAILPLKQVPEAAKRLIKYKRISQSIAEVGIIEPLVISRPQDETGKYLLLDGHWRRAIFA